MKNFLKLVIPFFYGEERSYARWCGAALLLLSQATTSFGYFFIQWNRRFFDALESKNSDLFFRESLVFIGLAVALVLVSGFSKFMAQQYALRWRMWMTRTALSTWLYSDTRGEIEGADQRIQEDLMRFTTIFERFFLECFNALLLIILFTPLLFSQTYHLQLGSFNLAFIFCTVAIAYTGFGMYISAKIANPLIQYEYDNQKLEAEFRYNLVHVRDGANKHYKFFDQLLSVLTKNYHNTFNRQKYFNIWQMFYNQSFFLIPYGLLAPQYFSGVLTLGMLMQIKSTFSRIRNSMAYILDHYTELTEMLAISRRLSEFNVAANINQTQNTPQRTIQLGLAP